MTPDEFTTHIAEKKKSFPLGPWTDEPDRLEFKTEEGFDALIIRQGLGFLCGYVAVREGHPLYEKHYNVGNDLGIEVHGGLTYADHCGEHICHNTLEDDDVWWLGFDCGHGGDLMPVSLEIKTYFPRLYPDTRDVKTYRTIDYVKAEISSLSKQLHAMVAV